MAPAFAVRKNPEAFALDKSGRKTASFKDEAHLAFIRKLPSVLSGEFGCDAAHIRSGSAIHNKKRTGGGQKPSDCWVLPLTRTEHDAQHTMGDEMAFWAKHGINPFDLALKLYDVTGNFEAALKLIRPFDKTRPSQENAE